MEKTPPNLELIFRYFGTLTSRQQEQLEALWYLYSDWNSRINVISRKDIGGLYEKHVLHSLSIAAFSKFRPGTTVVDIGTGGGFPGIPLAIFFPETTFHLVDSIAKKLTVVTEVAAATGLKNVTTQHTRAEGIRDRRFDYAVSRAVAPLKELWQWSKPLLRKKAALDIPDQTASGLRPWSELPPGLICLKGGDLKAEIAASGTHPVITDIYSLLPETFFIDKFILFIPALQSTKRLQ